MAKIKETSSSKGGAKDSAKSSSSADKGGSAKSSGPSGGKSGDGGSKGGGKSGDGGSKGGGPRPDRNIFLGDDAGGLFKTAGGIGVVFLLASFGLGFAEGDDLKHFSYSYLVSFMWVLSIVLGAL